MNDKEKKKLPKWLEKLKNVKHIEIYIAIIFIVIILLIYLSNSKTKETSSAKITYENEMSVTAYMQSIEKKLEESLSEIAGVSDVKVMITLNLNELEVTDNKVNLSTFPQIKGVLVTAKGVNNVTNKLKVLHAIEAVIDIKNGNIEILSSE